MQHNTDNVRIISSAPMVSPNTLIDKLPLSEKAASVVVSSRNAIKISFMEMIIDLWP